MKIATDYTIAYSPTPRTVTRIGGTETPGVRITTDWLVTLPGSDRQSRMHALLFSGFTFYYFLRNGRPIFLDRPESGIRKIAS